MPALPRDGTVTEGEVYGVVPHRTNRVAIIGTHRVIDFAYSNDMKQAL